MKKSIFIKAFLLIFLFSLNSTYARNCSGDLNIFDHNNVQSLIKVVDTTSGKYADSKRVHVSETVYVENLNLEKFEKISNDPDKIAYLLGGKVKSRKSNTNFRLEVPGVLGFDLSFDVKVNKITESEVQLDLSNFNTFFLGGSGKITISSISENGATVNMKGNAYIPKTAARVFVFGVGGEDNFKKFLQDEIDDQIRYSLRKFERLDL